MKDAVREYYEKAAEVAFNRQAPVFDDVYSGDKIIQYKRDRVRSHVLQLLKPNSNILELNAGTGEDAIFFAQKGHRIHATDISERMQEILKQKVKNKGLDMKVGNETCSFTQLDTLVNRGPFDLVFSNFAGLNCTDKLDGVLLSLKDFVKPGGFVTLVLLPKFCLWEFLLLFKGKFKTAFRRFRGKNGASAQIMGESFRCWYYNPSFVCKHLQPEFKQIALEGLCTIVPPSYIEGFADKYPRLYQFLLKQENKRCKNWPWKNIGDYYLISLRRR